jgi:hypothetical protein
MRRAWVLALVAVVSIAGCGRRREQPAPELKLEPLGDTAGLSKGEPLLNRIEPYRVSNGVLRVRGNVNFPDGVRIQISMYRKGTNEMLSRVQVVVDNHRFDSPPIIGHEGPLPHGRYRFEYLALFNEAWQSKDVMRRTDNGRALRGPGVTRDRVGGAAFYLVEERTL